MWWYAAYRGFKIISLLVLNKKILILLSFWPKIQVRFFVPVETISGYFLWWQAPHGSGHVIDDVIE